MIQPTVSNSRASSLPPSNIVRHGSHELYQYSDQQNLIISAPSAETKTEEFNSTTKCPTRHPSLFQLVTAPTQLNDSLGLCTFSSTVDEDSGYGQTPPNYSLQGVGSNSSIVTTSTPLSFDTVSSGFESRDELLHVMTEDLVDWFIHMYPRMTKDLEVDNFFDRLADGVLLGHHAGELHRTLVNSCSVVKKGFHSRLVDLQVGGLPALLPSLPPNHQTKGLSGNLATSGFVARDNVANFISWCRQLGMSDSVLFESEDLVCRKNVRNVAICLLELARLGGRVGMIVPELVQLEVDIDKEIATQPSIHDDRTDKARVTEHIQQESPTSSCSLAEDRNRSIEDDRTSDHELTDHHTQTTTDNEFELEEFNKRNHFDYRTNRATELRYRQLKQRTRSKASENPDVLRKSTDEAVNKKPEQQMLKMDLRSLDEIIRDLLSQCTCKQPFPMVRVGEGRYLFGAKGTQIFVRILRNHVMVRVGGGWDTLNHFLIKYDECRKGQSTQHYSPLKENKKVALVNNNNRTRSAHGESISQKNVESLLTDIIKKSRPCDENSRIQGEGMLNVKKYSLPTLDHRRTSETLASTTSPSAVRHKLSFNTVKSTFSTDDWSRATGSSVGSDNHNSGDCWETVSDQIVNNRNETHPRVPQQCELGSSSEDNGSLVAEGYVNTVSSLSKPAITSSVENIVEYSVPEVYDKLSIPSCTQDGPLPESRPDVLSSLPTSEGGGLHIKQNHFNGIYTTRDRRASTNSMQAIKPSLRPFQALCMSSKGTTCNGLDPKIVTSGNGKVEVTNCHKPLKHNRPVALNKQNGVEYRKPAELNLCASDRQPISSLSVGNSNEVQQFEKVCSCPRRGLDIPSNQPYPSLIPVPIISQSHSRLQ